MPTFILQERELGSVADRTRSHDGEPVESTAEDELRTIAFRLRELQRLLAARVEQENRRLAAEGIDPVTDRGFSTAPEDDAGDR